MVVPVIYHPHYFSDIGNHVFPTEKFQLIYKQLNKRVGAFEKHVYCPQSATNEQLRRVHTLAYLTDLNSYEHTSRTFPSELPISKEIVEAYYLMAGGSCLAAKLALQYGCSFNIGGGFHHAFADKAEGFCYINDIAVAVKDVMKGENGKSTINRAAVIDTDLHQGNGTAHIFQDDPDVFTFSIHQENNYPLKQKSDIDIGLDDGIQDDLYLTLLEDALKKIFNEFNPQFIIYVAGVDPYEQDQLGGLMITKNGMRDRDKMVFEYCRKHQALVATVLAGGYAFDVNDTVEMHVNTYLALSSIYS